MPDGVCWDCARAHGKSRDPAIYGPQIYTSWTGRCLLCGKNEISVGAPSDFGIYRSFVEGEQQ